MSYEFGDLVIEEGAETGTIWMVLGLAQHDFTFIDDFDQEHWYEAYEHYACIKVHKGDEEGSWSEHWGMTQGIRDFALLPYEFPKEA